MPADAGGSRLTATGPAYERELALNPAAAITGASKVAFVTADAISHGDTASSRGHRPAAPAAAAALSSLIV